MRVLVFNAGSSSVKFGVFDLPSTALGDAQERLRGDAGPVWPEGCDLKLSGQARRRAEPRDLAEATALVPALLVDAGLDGFDAVAHRIAHGGDRSRAGDVLDDPDPKANPRLDPLAPLHTPPNLAAVEMAQQLLARPAAMGRVRYGGFI